MKSNITPAPYACAWKEKAFMVVGDSMSGLINPLFDGDIVLINQDKKPETDKIIVIEYEGKLIIGFYEDRLRTNHFALCFANLNYSPLLIPLEDKKIIGVAVEVRRFFI